MDMSTRFYTLKKKFDQLSELSETEFVNWLNDSILTERGTKIRPIDEDEEWELTRVMAGGTRNMADIIAQSTKAGIYSSQDSWFMYDPYERRVYSFAGPAEIRDFFEELICNEIENTEDSFLYTAE